MIHATLQYFIKQYWNSDSKMLDPAFYNALKMEIARLADINAIDINLYSDNGALLLNSQPAIYEQGLLARRMNPKAFFNLRKTKSIQTTQQEQIGALNYLATYSPLLSTSGDAIAYLGIPYFERARDVNAEVSSFLVSLINVYAFLLICAALLAYFVSNSITQPLTIIGNKLRILNLNKKNEAIEWHSRDEIGILVGEYNKMIAELEQSAQKLAKGERESAWREMAKQIAHEIKNPLTPMKLSIQYLQRSIDEGKPNIEELAKKVAKTLEEQIENLSSIATAFASFAKMPKPENEIIDFKSLIKGIVDLFNGENGVIVSLECTLSTAFVFADRNQWISVFNNLIKNGIQSIPEGKKGFVEVKMTKEEGWILVSVSDNGIGILQENADRVFVPNFTTKSSGTGLGLAITKQIVDGAGGSIWFESKPDEGTTFFVRLKLYATDN
ncbi:MAG: HAMP domain-containing histidine kinase [Bacteroidetes bacterium]|nr:HAMP domain-containing histidine kinase [Bacteroidota bacterium]